DQTDKLRIPVDDKGRPVARELVRINHLRNCLMCHAPAASRLDENGRLSVSDSASVLAPGPTPGEPLPPPVAYYATPNNRPLVLVRADITYLRQDFSSLQPVEYADQWPDEQRFDYFVRQRLLAVSEAQTPRDLLAEQRKAAVWAIAELR